MGGRVGRRWREKSVGHGAVCDRNAERRRRGRSDPRCTSNRCAQHHFYFLAGITADDPEHVQDRRRTDAECFSHRGPIDRRASVVDFRRSQRCDGCSRYRVGNAVFGFRPGSAGPGVNRPRGHARIAHPISAFLRRVSHVARDLEDRHRFRRGVASDDRRGARNRASRSRALA